ncbi:MAG: hypothetical protein CMP11_03130 [Zetaproteobacteria bacterium]|nr:hypothetical protein [Pseudobdellovibrionaceae bacterium]|tara:strand:+ start:568 stop:1575 length:1008 start_codon:yes stop_codon:yes gene_type:complete
MIFLGLDIGGTKVELSLLTLEQGSSKNSFSYQDQSFHWEIINRQRISTNRLDSYSHFIERLEFFCQSVCKDSSVSFDDITGCGLALPGTVCNFTKKMLNGNSRFLVGKNLQKDLNDTLMLRCPVVSMNDANCFTLAESLLGAGKNLHQKEKERYKNFSCFGLILGTGVGGGFYYQNKIFQGRRGSACEVGHIELVTNGLPCYCGRSGCSEQYLSGPGFEASFRTRMYGQILSAPSAKEIFDLHEKGEPMATATIIQYKKYLGKFLGNLIQSFDPSCFVFGGGMSKEKLLYEDLLSFIKPHTYVKENIPSITAAKLGDSAGSLGACLLPFIENHEL